MSGLTETSGDEDRAPTGFGRWLPIVSWLPNYDRRWLRPDLIAGLTLWALLVPEAMAYADMAGMPPETGLYAGVGGIIGYSLFGTSRQLFVGPSSTVAILSFSTVGAVASAGTEDFVQLSVALALMVGVIYIGMGLARLGFVAKFMSQPVLTGFTFGLALTIAIGQAPKLFGVEGGDGNFFEQGWELLADLSEADGLTTAIGLGSLAILFISSRLFGHKMPMALIVVFGSIILSSLLDWAAEGVHVVGEIPGGFSGAGLPDVDFDDMVKLIGGALGIVIVGYAESLAAAKEFARKHDYSVDPDQELIALGASNIAAGLMGAFTVDGSLSRTAAGDEAGMRSQMATLSCGVITVLTILAFTWLFEDLPEAVLGAIVIHAVWHLFKVQAMRRIWHANRLDFAAAAGALLGVLLLDLLAGLIIAVLISFVMLVYRASEPNTPRLGRLDAEGASAYVAIERHPEAVEPDGCVVARFDGPLFFANAETLAERVDELSRRFPEVRALVLDMEPVSYIDMDGAQALGTVATTLRERGKLLVVARLNQAGREALRRVGSEAIVGEENFYESVRAAVAAIEAASPEPGGQED